MMRNKGISLLIPILFLAMIALLLSVPQESAFAQLRFRADAQELTPWYQEEEDRYYLFLPSFLSQQPLSVSHPWYIRYEWEGADAGTDMPMDQDITVKAAFLFNRQKTYTLHLLPCSAKQTICIDAQEGMLSYLHADQEHVQNGFVTFWDENGRKEYAGKAAISGRGNSTWENEKKPYDLRFSEPIRLGLFEDIQKLCLFAEHFDTSKMRNAAAYRAGQILELPYASAYAYADLFLNGQYMGLYGMTTKEEYTKHIEEDSIQAVFELSVTGKGQVFTTDAGKGIRVYYGDPDLVCYKVEAMEAALAAQDPQALLEHIDLASWAEKYAMDELFYNYDLSLTSEYFYLDREGKIRCMLPWDYDWTLHARLYPYSMATEYALCAYYNLPNWYSQLLELEVFREAVCKIYDSVYTEDFFREINRYLAECEQELGDSWYSDLVRWKDSQLGSQRSGAQLSDQPPKITQALPARLEFLKTLFHNWEEHCLITFWSDQDGEIQPFKLQLILPKGDFTPYQESVRKSVYPPAGCQMLGVYTEDGVPLEEITVITEDTPLYVRSISSQEEVNHE